MYPVIPEEPRLSQRVREAAARDALGHALVISGGGDLMGAAHFFAAAMECESRERPCGVCGPCRKVLRGIHPDVITVKDPEHKNIAVDVLRSVVSDAYILPNEGRRKIYIFPDCSLLDPKAQNVLLKVVEEGPVHAAFLFCAENSGVLLSTIRSRAVEWKLANAEAEGVDEDGQAERFCRLLCGGQEAALASFCAELENGKVSREDLQGMLSGARDVMTAALACCYTGQGGELAGVLARQLGRRRISRIADVLEEFIQQCNYNVGVGHVTGALAAVFGLF